MSLAEDAPNIDEVVRKANVEIQMENRNLQAINIQLHEKYHTISLKVIIESLVISGYLIYVCLWISDV